MACSQGLDKAGEAAHGLISTTYHILPVEHLQDVAEQLAACLQVLLPLQVVLELVCHHGEQDLSAVCIEHRIVSQQETPRKPRGLQETVCPLECLIHKVWDGN